MPRPRAAPCCNRHGSTWPPFSHAYLTTLGESLLPQMPLSLTTSVIMPYSLNAPFSHAYLTTLGESLLPQMPLSLTTSVIMPYSLNAVMPGIGTGFDLGVELHGLLRDRFGYEVGIFNGTGASVNTAGKTLSDDWHIPSLLYAGRLTYMPWGVMPATQGNPNRLRENKLLVGVSASINVESEYESTNDTRVGLEAAAWKPPGCTTGSTWPANSTG